MEITNILALTFWSILRSIQLEGFLWGLGTSIGELPPYFVARKASLLGKKHAELEEEEENIRRKDSSSVLKISFTERIKKMIFDHVRKHSFITVLLLASIPNPLFDLAGLTCGHLLIPFLTFFVATSIGKAVIKVHLQLAFVIFAFSKPRIEFFIKKLTELVSPSWGNKLRKLVEKQKGLLVTGEEQKSESMVGKVWNILLTIMILYFVASIVNGVVKEEWLDQKKLKKNIKEQKKKNN